MMELLLERKPKPKYSLKEYEAFHLYSMDKEKLIKLIVEGYFDNTDSELIRNIINETTKECHDRYMEMKAKRQSVWNQIIANQEYQARLDKEAKAKKEAEYDADRLIQLKRFLKLI